MVTMGGAEIEQARLNRDLFARARSERYPRSSVGVEFVIGGMPVLRRRTGRLCFGCYGEGCDSRRGKQGRGSTDYGFPATPVIS